MEALVLLLALGLLGALGAVVLLVRQLSSGARADGDAVVVAAVHAALEAAGATLATERAQVVQAAVDGATAVASSKLSDTVQAGSREMDLRVRSFEQQVGHIGEALVQLGGLVAELQRDSATQSGSLLAQLEAVTATQRDLAAHTAELRAALASPKARGQWGERMADDVLAAAGFKEGVSFRRQRAVAGGGVPDFAFLLPQDLELRMDVKFPIDNYLRALEADDDAVRARATKAFVADVRNRIRELSGRGYVDARDTVDCMLLFIPNEAVYAFLHEADPDVIDVALAEQVILCSPATLFAVLAVVRRSVEQFRLERTSDEILRCLGAVTQEWDKFSGALDKVGRQLDQAHRSFHDELAGTRRRVLQRRFEEVEALRGAGPTPTLAPGEALVAQKAAGDVRPLPRAGGADDGAEVADAG